MRRKTLLLSFMMFMTLTSPMAGFASSINLQVCNRHNPIKKGIHNPKAPVRCPSAFIDGHTLYIEGCDGCTIQLLYGNEIIYSAVIADGMIELPDNLSGIYELQILKGDYCFWAEIEL